MDTGCLIAMAIFVVLDGAIVGKKYRRLMLEEEAVSSCSPSIYSAEL